MKRISWVASVAFVLTASTRASGPLGHVVMAHHTVEGILAGKVAAPPELKGILSDPEVARAYYGGAVGPDLYESLHYNKTSEPPNRMLAAARSDLAKATKSGNAAQIKTARQELAFAYGWFNHCAADLNIHPVINSMVGDTYRYTNKAEQAVHAEIEAQFTRFLAHGQELPTYDPIIPVDFMSRTAFASKAAIKEGITTLVQKATAERAYAKTVAAIAPDLDGAFRLAESTATSDNIAFLRNPKNLKDWDLDSGKISTNDFETLREATSRANDGTLPKNWGAMYLTWNARTSGLNLAQKIKVMSGILAGAGTPDRVIPTKTTTDSTKLPKGGAWVLDHTEFSVQYANDLELAKKSKAQESGSDGMGTAQATFGHPDPNIFVTVRVKVAWTSPDKVLIPGKTYRWRFAIYDAGSDNNQGLFVGGNGSLGANCPAMSDVWYGPAASIDLHEKKLQGEATKEFTPRLAADGTILYVGATWNVGVRAANFVYVYKFKAK